MTVYRIAYVTFPPSCCAKGNGDRLGRTMAIEDIGLGGVELLALELRGMTPGPHEALELSDWAPGHVSVASPCSPGNSCTSVCDSKSHSASPSQVLSL